MKSRTLLHLIQESKRRYICYLNSYLGRQNTWDINSTVLTNN